jgi:hypothetical protein
MHYITVATPTRLGKTMEETKKIVTNKNEPPAEQPEQPSRKAKIESQVLAKIGRPPRLDRVEVSIRHNGNCRVNIWQRPEPNKDIAVTISPRIAWSFYLTVSATGEIVDSDPPMIRLDSCA